MSKDFSGVTHYTHVDVQPGGINIQHVEHLHQADLLERLGIELEVKKKGSPLPAEKEEEPLDEDRRIRQAILLMREEKILKHKYDLVFVMQAMNETDRLKNFDSPQSFLNYISGLGVDDIPSADSLKKKFGEIRGRHPSWSFSDTKDATETKRRNNVATRFLSIYYKEK